MTSFLDFRREGRIPPGYILTPVYEQVEIPANDRWPRFMVLRPLRDPSESDVEYRLACLYAEEEARRHGILLGLSQLAATALGRCRDCTISTCRRKKRCAARRDEDDWSVTGGPMMPPCCDTQDKIDAVQMMIRAWLKARLSAPKGPGPLPPRNAPGARRRL